MKKVKIIRAADDLAVDAVIVSPCLRLVKGGTSILKAIQKGKTCKPRCWRVMTQPE